MLAYTVGVVKRIGLASWNGWENARVINRLTALAKTYQRDKARADKSREALADAIIEAAASNVPQVEIVKATGYTRERVRLILLKAREKGRL